LGIERGAHSASRNAPQALRLGPLAKTDTTKTEMAYPIRKMDLGKQDTVVWIGFAWLRIEVTGQLLWV
jgi:hypothetical protein